MVGSLFCLVVVIYRRVWPLFLEITSLVLWQYHGYLLLWGCIGGFCLYSWRLLHWYCGNITVTSCCGDVSEGFASILGDYFTGIVAISRLPLVVGMYRRVLPPFLEITSLVLWQYTRLPFVVGMYRRVWLLFFEITSLVLWQYTRLPQHQGSNLEEYGLHGYRGTDNIPRQNIAKQERSAVSEAGIIEGTSNYIPLSLCDVITCPCP